VLQDQDRSEDIRIIAKEDVIKDQHSPLSPQPAIQVSVQCQFVFDVSHLRPVFTWKKSFLKIIATAYRL